MILETSHRFISDPCGSAQNQAHSLRTRYNITLRLELHAHQRLLLSRRLVVLSSSVLDADQPVEPDTSSLRHSAIMPPPPPPLLPVDGELKLPKNRSTGNLLSQASKAADRSRVRFSFDSGSTDLEAMSR